MREYKCKEHRHTHKLRLERGGKKKKNWLIDGLDRR